MTANHLRDLDQTWEQDRQQYMIYSFQTGKRDEPIDPSYLMFIVGAVVAFGSFLAGLIVFGRIAPLGPLAGGGLVALIVLGCIFLPVYQLSVSLRYQKARCFFRSMTSSPERTASPFSVSINAGPR